MTLAELINKEIPASNIERYLKNKTLKINNIPLTTEILNRPTEYRITRWMDFFDKYIVTEYTDNVNTLKHDVANQQALFNYGVLLSTPDDLYLLHE